MESQGLTVTLHTCPVYSGGHVHVNWVPLDEQVPPLVQGLSLQRSMIIEKVYVIVGIKITTHLVSQ